MLRLSILFSVLTSRRVLKVLQESKLLEILPVFYNFEELTFRNRVTFRSKKEKKMSKVNQKIPEFEVQAFHKDEFKTLSSDDTKGKWSVFFFYPADFTFVCPTELEDLADFYQDFKSIDTEIYSISTDTHYVHKAWHDASDTIKKIQFPMLADPTGRISRGFDVMIEEEGVTLRATFVVNPEGYIKVIEINDLGIGRSAKELLRKVQAAQFVATHGSEVCPAKWQPGQKTLKPGIELVGKI